MFAVAAQSLSPLSYQWRRDGGELSGGDSDEYVIKSAAEADSGTYDIVVTNACGSTPSRPALVQVRPCFHRGDYNASGETDISDAAAIFDFLFLGGPASLCRESADTNNSGAIDISDGIALLGFLFLGSSPPATPGPPSLLPCGPDPDVPGSPGDLGCEGYTGACR